MFCTAICLCNMKLVLIIFAANCLLDVLYEMNKSLTPTPTLQLRRSVLDLISSCNTRDKCSWSVKFEVLTAVIYINLENLKNTVIWNVIPYSLVEIYRPLRKSLLPPHSTLKTKVVLFFRKVGKFVPFDIVSHLRRHYFAERSILEIGMLEVL